MKRKTYKVQVLTSTGDLLSTKRYAFNSASKAGHGLVCQWAQERGISGELERVDGGKEAEHGVTVHGWRTWRQVEAPHHCARIVINLEP